MEPEEIMIASKGTMKDRHGKFNYIPTAMSTDTRDLTLYYAEYVIFFQYVRLRQHIVIR